MSGKLPEKTGVAVCTIEKANSLITRMIEEGSLLDSFSAVIVDELHMVDDEDRGYLLELLLTKLRHVCKLSEQDVHAVQADAPGAEPTGKPSGLLSEAQGKSFVTQMLGSAASGASQGHRVQLIGMSATLPNLSLIGAWLGAAVFESRFRPVRLFPSCLELILGLRGWEMRGSSCQPCLQVELKVSLLHNNTLRTPVKLQDGQPGVTWEQQQVQFGSWDPKQDVQDGLGFLVHETVQVCYYLAILYVLQSQQRPCKSPLTKPKQIGFILLGVSRSQNRCWSSVEHAIE
jgi:hypothetical protein